MEWLVIGTVFVAVLGFILAIRGGWGRSWKLQRPDFRPPVSLLLVVQNQERTIEGVIRRLRGLRNRSSVCFELVVFDNGSLDSTAAILERMWRGQEDFRLYRLDTVKGPHNPLEVIQWVDDNRVIYQVDLQRSVRPRRVIQAVDRALREETSSGLVRRIGAGLRA